MKEFIFRQKEKDIWEDRTLNMKSHFYLLIEGCKQDFSVVIDKYKPKRTQPQLGGYFRLVGICMDHMNTQGNNFTKDEVDTYFRIEAGHYNVIKGVKVPRSIKSTSDTTAEEMSRLIKCVVEFGASNYIRDCYLEPTALRDMLSYYRSSHNE